MPKLLARAVWVLLLCWISATRVAFAQAAPVTETALSNSLSTLAQFQASLANSSQIVSNASLGPYSISGSCGYDCWGKLCIMNQHWSWQVDFSGTRVPLQQVLQVIQQQYQQFSPTMTSVSTWETSTLPAFSNTFTNAANAILALNTQIQQNGGTTTQQQRQQIASEFQQIETGIQQSSGALNTAIQALSQYMQQQQAEQTSIASLSQNVQNSIDQEITQTQKNFIPTLHCGQSDATKAISGMENQFNQSFQQIEVSVGSMQTSAQTANQALSLLTGSLISLQSSYSLADQQIQQSQASPVPIIQNLHLDVAEKTWQGLAAYAAQQLK
ncbi:MAG: hypothetical protein WA510_11530 [Acidobacteriaceae bacterium]